jgi:predicted dehydrogenase
MIQNVGILGLGNIADNALAPALKQIKNARLWSVMSRDKDRANRFAQKHGAQSPHPAYTNLDDMLKDSNLNAVIVATPDRLHADHAIRCAQAGKHVLVEKPMATDTASGKAIVTACQQAKVTLAVAYHLRWHAGHRMLIDEVHSGKLGELRHMRAQWTWREKDNLNWRASEQVGRWWSLAGVGTHCLDMIRWVMVPLCGEIVNINSLITKDVWKGPHDETALVSLKFESGATAEFCSSVLFESPYRVEIYGNSGHAICDGTLGRKGLGQITLNSKPINFIPTNPYAGEIEDFIESITEKRPPEVDGREGLRNIKIIDAIENRT